jgi:catechol 2,3-dioxygenase-like lactoylglutathione lyase family enzyme
VSSGDTVVSVRARAVTVGIPVRDLERATAWYRAALVLGEPDLVPAEGLVEFDLGSFWLQLSLAPERAGARGVSVNVSVEDASDERLRLAENGVSVSELQHIEGVVDYFELEDPDGNVLGFVTELT